MGYWGYGGGGGGSMYAGKVGKKRALGEYEDLEENDFKKLRGMTNSHGAQLFYRSTLEGIVAPRIAKREADHARLLATHGGAAGTTIGLYAWSY